ncbi:MAG: alpha/beta hydrolase [Bdellovibrionales bacterium]|nr:alpha/beta hydrolase [Bdellovibrionales bacterium]
MDAGKGTTLLCVPGGPGFDAASLMPGILKLSALFNLLIVNPRGHGRSDDAENNDYSIEAYAHELLAVGNQLRLRGQKVGILGHSFGGVTSIAALAKDSSIFHFAILVDAPCDTAWQSGIPAELERLGITQSTEQAEAQFSAAPPTDQSCKDLMVSYARMYFPELPESVAKATMQTWDFTVAPYLVAVESIFGSFDLRAELPKIKLPTLVIGGEKDGLIPSKYLNKLAQALPAADYREIPGAGHFPFLTKADVFYSTVNDWWSGQMKGVSQ